MKTHLQYYRSRLKYYSNYFSKIKKKTDKTIPPLRQKMNPALPRGRRTILRQTMHQPHPIIRRVAAVADQATVDTIAYTRDASVESIESTILSPQHKIRVLASPPPHEKRKKFNIHHDHKVTMRLRGASTPTFEGRLELVANPPRLTRSFANQRACKRHFS